MILKKLTLHNFGIYAGTNTFDFDSDKPVVLIGGLNGRGKTTFLESVLLALYGRRSFAFSESKLTYPAYLCKLQNSTNGSLKTYIEIEFVIGHNESHNNFILKREWSAAFEDVKDSIRVFKNGNEDSFLSDNWAMYIEEILPSAISNFFFFDGEKISELAVESTGEQMRKSIKALLGIDVLDRLEADLKKILSGKSKKLTASYNYQAIQGLRDKENVLEERTISIHRDIAEINTFNSQCQREIENLEAQFMAKGGGIGNNKAKLVVHKKQLDDELTESNEKLLELVSAELPLALVEPLLKSIYKSASSEQESRNERYAAQRINQLFIQFMQNNPKAITKQLNDFLGFVKSNSESNAEEQTPLYELTDNGLLQAKLLSNSYLRNKIEETRQLQERRTKIKAEIDEAENYLMVEVDELAIGTIYQKIKKLTADIGANNERKRQLEIEEAEVNSQLILVRREHAKLIEKSLAELESMDESARTVKYTSQAIQLTQAYRLRLQEQKTTTLAEVMTDCYKKIANKKNLIDRVEIHAETLDFIYYDADGVVVDKKRLSAGEKQLMVIAMLWALALCSNNRLPVIIDTPLARLDSAHRERIVKAYFPYASEQTIILSTDAEIDTNYYKMLKPFVGKEYTLVYNDSCKSTTIVEGYFGDVR